MRQLLAASPLVWILRIAEADYFFIQTNYSFIKDDYFFTQTDYVFIQADYFFIQNDYFFIRRWRCKPETVDATSM